MNNIFFIELIVKSFNDTFSSSHYEYQEDDLIKNGVNISALNQVIKDKYRYKFLSELKRHQQNLYEKEKLEFDIFLDKLKEACFILNNEVLAFKEKEFQKQKGLSFGEITDLDRDSFFDLLETETELYNIPLSVIVKEADKEILFNLGDIHFIKKTTGNIKISDFEDKNESKAEQNDLYIGLQGNIKAIELFEFLCENYRPNEKTKVKYVNILHYLKKDVDKNIYVFKVKQDKYADLIEEMTGLPIKKFAISEQYDDIEKPVLKDIERRFRGV